MSKVDGIIRYNLEDIFGTGCKTVVKSYLQRSDVDIKFINEIERTNKHIVVYGGSKQGKTSLIRHFGKKLSNSITIQMGSHISTPEDLYRILFTRLDIKVEGQSSVQNNLSGAMEVGGKFNIPFMASAGTNIDARIEEIDLRSFSTDKSSFCDPSIILKKLEENKKTPDFIIIENYHFAPKVFLEKFAEDLRTWNDLGLRFIILGVFKNQDELQLRENNLRGRISYISVEPWREEDLLKVINQGLKHLKVSLDDEMKKQMVQGCLTSVGLLQEIVCLFFRSIMILETQDTLKSLNYSEYEFKITETFNELTNDYKDIFRFLKALSQKATAESNYFTFWLVLYLYDNSGDQWDKGIRLDEIVTFTYELIQKNNIEDQVKTKDFFNLKLKPEIIKAEHEIKESFLKALPLLNEISREISTENNLYYDNHKIYVVNNYLSFYIKNCFIDEDIDEFYPPW